jgi:hypothetical protein
VAFPSASPKLIERIRAELAANGGNVSAAAGRLKITRDTVRKYRDADPGPAAVPAEPADPVAAAVPAEPADPVAAAEAEHARLRELFREREALRDVAGERSFRAYLAGLIQAAAPTLPPPPKFRAAPPALDAVDESLLLVLSDWHAYEVVKPERVLGLNTYNADVAGRRVWQVGRSVASIREKMTRAGWRFPRLVVAANGDFISGTIHEVERHSDAPNVVQAAFGCGMLLAQLLRDLAAGFEAVEVFGTSGNHGRLPDARRVQQKDPTRSWDYLIYLFARTALADCPNVRFFLPDSYSVVYDVEGWRFMQTHGHDVKSWQNIPFYGISRAATGINALRSAIGEPIHYFLYSHFHNKGSIEAAGGEYFVNGSLIGGTEFSVNGLGRADRPCQWLLGVHRENGVTHRWPLYADAKGATGTYDPRPWGGA